MKNQIIIRRFKETSDCTICEIKLIKDDKELMNCYGLEPLKEGVERNKGLRIPTGKYKLTWHISRKFSKKLPLLYNALVPKDRDILIHAGNYPSDSVGCILVGEKFRVYGNNKGLIENSNLALQKILATLIKYSGKDLNEWEVSIINEMQKEGE